MITHSEANQRMFIVNRMIGSIRRPMYLLQMSGTRVSEEHFSRWVRELRDAAVEMTTRCDEYLEKSTG